MMPGLTPIDRDLTVRGYMKRIVTMQDLSCTGKCSLTVALPILSAMGIEAAVLPTAVLSGHLGFKEPSVTDLTERIPSILDAWRREGMTFDAVCTGYLASWRQVDIVRELYRSFGTKGALHFVDPAMADGGRLYRGVPDSFVDAMRQLCAGADVSMPNITEACLLTGTQYRENADAQYCADLAKRLAAQGSLRVIITGFSSSEGSIGAVSYDRETEELSVYENKRMPASFTGTGDIFAAVTEGAVVRGYTLGEAVQLAVDFTMLCVKKTLEDPDHRWYGVNFEQALPSLIHWMEEHKGAERL
jgi:pyridoxine kinase